jgi:hypothetical protein
VKDEIPQKLVIAGEERWRTKEDLELIERLGIKDWIYFTGWSLMIISLPSTTWLTFSFFPLCTKALAYRCWRRWLVGVQYSPQLQVALRR